MSDDKPVSMKDTRTQAEIAAEKEAQEAIGVVDWQQPIAKKPDGTPHIDLSDYEKDPVTGRYVIPFEVKSASVPDGLLWGKAELFREEQMRALREIQKEWEAHHPVLYKPLEKTTPAERGKRVLQYNLGDYDEWLGNARGVMAERPNEKGMGKTAYVIVDNDWIAQLAEGLSVNFWEKGGLGWAILAHEHGHAMGFGHDNAVPGIMRSVVDMPGRIFNPTSEGMTEQDWKKFEKVWGKADPVHPAPPLEMDSNHPSGLASRSNSPKATSMKQKRR